MKSRMALYLSLSVVTDLLLWSTNVFDLTPRGLAVIFLTCAKNALLVARSYIDQSKSRLEGDVPPPKLT